MRTYTGFDSAWGGRNTGAVCHLHEVGPRRLELEGSSWASGVTWSSALDNLTRAAGDNHVLAIDQPLVVPNAAGSRPVDLTVARALMSEYSMGAHAANRTNPCFGDGAGIWPLLDGLASRGYTQAPEAARLREPGKFFFECYPNIALVGWLDCLPRYKVRHGDREAWQRVVDFLRSLSTAEVPIVNAEEAIPSDLEPTKVNEDRLDALIAAYSAAWHVGFDGSRSLVVGDMMTGYIVTPVNDTTRSLLLEAWARRDVATSRSRGPEKKAPANLGRRAPPVEPKLSDQVELVCVDTTNLWGRRNAWMTRFEGAELVVRFVEEDGEPTVRFVPFATGGTKQRGMKISPSVEDRSRWIALAAGTSSSSPRSFPVSFWYEDPAPIH